MLKEQKFMSPVALFAAAAALAVFAAGCGTDEETFQSKNTVKTTPAPPAHVATTPPARTPLVTVPEVPEPPREVTYEEAEAAYNAKRYDEACDLFMRYSERKPDNPWGHYMLGLSAWKAGALETAETEFRRTIALDTTHVKSYVNLARVLLDAGRPGEAYTNADNALIIDASSVAAWRVKGRVCHTLGRTDEAVGAYRNAIRLDPEDAWSMNNLAFIWIEQERFEEALGPLARAIELRGDVAVFHNNLGMALERSGHPLAAEAEYVAATNADPLYEKAALNGERIAQVLKGPDEVPVDLAGLARDFVTGIDGTDEPALATATPDRAEVPPVTSSAPDSTLADSKR
ncbi:MAG: tetratricopeptide repeat protein [Candidatus Krumholzibacteria bacterium]|nr:tetratricopeptide repeat protein [Candidatus Krumholzibacteria bacterium]MDH4335737.1 tetratricopeptide repeat protein [Candidatus Krumholzibacteria bacterium]MDH5269263.1 tetratricopeptide repeat protein [Candidatus Krumholzibacteria bacterium]